MPEVLEEVRDATTLWRLALLPTPVETIEQESRASSNRVHQEEGQPKVDEGRKPIGCPTNRFRTSLLQYLTASHSLQPANHLYWLLPLLILARNTSSGLWRQHKEQGRGAGPR
ncbi:uncharacterized protein [Triticum aestivum]|uniref:uncharacterized protein n=1 Tax=Triticum aestivum TaxID=4565 RepID=UPI001D01398C|nr:uncharacterized protein LOC123165225 [Triticum aestivum]